LPNPTPDDRISSAISLTRDLIAFAEPGPLSLETPAMVALRMGEANVLIDRVKAIVHAGRTKVEYFDVSLNRYAHYLAACLSLPKGARILEVGGAPGHVSIGLHLAGFDLVSINLNELWRETYPDPEWPARLGVMEHDVEKSGLPFPDRSFDGVLFTEVLEHVAVDDPVKTLKEIRRVLVPRGLLILSTPNVCNISNILALARGVNVFWAPELFYGSLDRHNREYTPAEVLTAVNSAGLEPIHLYGMNSDNNWRSGVEDLTYAVLAAVGDGHSLLRNTSVCLARS
jgi:2-polyprenyl-3-methyl-5-hydroxy-6-metoxy-1,4-benzoquinol methylase